jgi:hypothetical protein
MRGSHRLAIAGTVAAVTAAAVTVSLLPGSPGSRPDRSSRGERAGSPASVAAVLRTAAATAARQPAARVPGPGQFLYLRDIELKGGGTPLARCSTGVRQEWMAANRSGRQTGSYPPGCGHGFTQKWPAGAIAPHSLDGWPIDLLAWQGLPTNPAALQRAIVRRYESAPPSVTITGGSLRVTGLPIGVVQRVEHSVLAKTPGHRFTQATGQAIYLRLRALIKDAQGHGRTSGLPSATFVYAALLLQLDAPPVLRAALFRVLERLPGVQTLGQATDRLGRHGIAVGLTTGGARNELIFDPATSRALEQEQVAVAPRQSGNNNLPPGTVLGYVVYVSIGVVNSGTATPPASGAPAVSGQAA